MGEQSKWGALGCRRRLLVAQRAIYGVPTDVGHILGPPRELIGRTAVSWLISPGDALSFDLFRLSQGGTSHGIQG
jgi:hypothetical protein